MNFDKLNNIISEIEYTIDAEDIKYLESMKDLFDRMYFELSISSGVVSSVLVDVDKWTELGIDNINKEKAHTKKDIEFNKRTKITEYPWQKKRDKEGYSDLSIDGVYSLKKWIDLRNHKLQLNPLCEHCEKEKKVTPAVMVDHKIPVYSESDPLMYDLDNLQSLCNLCNRRKTRNDHSKYSNKNLAKGKKIMDMFESE